MEIVLGDRVRDRITGIEGIVIGITDWLYGCRRVGVQPEKAQENGTPQAVTWFDAESLQIVEEKAITRDEERPLASVGGPQQDPGQRHDAAR